MYSERKQNNILQFSVKFYTSEIRFKPPNIYICH